MVGTAAARRAGSRRWAGVAAWTLWVLTMLSLAVLPWLDRLLRQAGRPDLVQLTSDAAALVLAVVSAATVGAVLAGRRPRGPLPRRQRPPHGRVARVRPAAHPDRIAAVAQVALVGQGRGGRAGAGPSVHGAAAVRVAPPYQSAINPLPNQ